MSVPCHPARSGRSLEDAPRPVDSPIRKKRKAILCQEYTTTLKSLRHVANRAFNIRWKLCRA